MQGKVELQGRSKSPSLLKMSALIWYRSYHCSCVLAPIPQPVGPMLTSISPWRESLKRENTAVLGRNRDVRQDDAGTVEGSHSVASVIINKELEAAVGKSWAVVHGDAEKLFFFF